MNQEQARINMIEQQIRPWNVLDQTVLDTLSFIPREHFAPLGWKQLAFADMSIPLGHDETMLTPSLEAHILQAVNIQSNDLCLEVGTGSGFLTACMAHLAREVDSVDIHSLFTKTAYNQLEKQHIKNVNPHTGDIFKLINSQLSSDYDVIVLGASLPTYQAVFEEHLVIGGRLFAVVGEQYPMQATLVTRKSEKMFEREVLFETELKPLHGTESDLSFTF